MKRWLLNFVLGLAWGIGFTVLATAWIAMISIAAVFSVMHYLSTQYDPRIVVGIIVMTAIVYASVRSALAVRKLGDFVDEQWISEVQEAWQGES